MSKYLLTAITFLLLYTLPVPAEGFYKRPTFYIVKAYQAGQTLHVDIHPKTKAWVELILIGEDGKRYEAPRPYRVKGQQKNELTLPITLLPRGTYMLTLYAYNERIHTEKMIIT